MVRTDTAVRRPAPTAEELASLLDQEPSALTIHHEGVWHERASARLPVALLTEQGAHDDSSRASLNAIFFLEEIFELAYIHLARNRKIRMVTKARDVLTDPLLIETDFLSDALSIVHKMRLIAAVRKKQVTRRHAAEMLGVHENTVARWAKDPNAIGKLVYELQYIMLEQVAILTGMTVAVVKSLSSEALIAQMRALRTEYEQNYK